MGEPLPAARRSRGSEAAAPPSAQPAPAPRSPGGCAGEDRGQRLLTSLSEPLGNHGRGRARGSLGVGDLGPGWEQPGAAVSRVAGLRGVSGPVSALGAVQGARAPRAGRGGRPGRVFEPGAQTGPAEVSRDVAPVSTYTSGCPDCPGLGLAAPGARGQQRLRTAVSGPGGFPPGSRLPSPSAVDP